MSLSKKGIAIINELEDSSGQIGILNLQNSNKLDSILNGEIEMEINMSLNPEILPYNDNQREMLDLVQSFWTLSGVSLEDSINFSTLRMFENRYIKFLKELSEPLNLIRLNSFQAKGEAFIAEGLQFASYLLNTTGVKLDNPNVQDFERFGYLVLVNSIANRILNLSLKTKNHLKPSDTSLLQDFLNIASSVREALSEKKWSLESPTSRHAIKKIVQAFFLIEQNFDVMIRSFSYAGPILKEMVMKQVNIITQGHNRTNENTTTVQEEESSLRLDLILQKSNLVNLLPKKSDFYLFIQKVRYLTEKDSTKYPRILGKFRTDLQLNQKLNAANLIDENFTVSFYKLFGNLVYSLSSIPSGKEEAYQKILNKTLLGLEPRIEEAFNALEARKSLIYLNIEEEYNKNVLKTIPVLLDNYAVQVDIKLNWERNRFMLIHEYLFLQALENICQILMTSYCLSANSTASFRKEYNRLFNSSELKLNILDSNLAGDFRLYLAYLFEKNELSFEMLLEFKTRIYVEQLFWDKRCSEANVRKEDLTYLTYRGMEEVEMNETLKSFFVSTTLANDLTFLWKSLMRLKKENGYGDILFIILWLFKSFWNDQQGVIDKVRQLLTMANSLKIINSQEGQQRLKNAYEQFEKETLESRGPQTEDVISNITRKVQGEVLDLLKIVITLASSKSPNLRYKFLFIYKC